MKRKSISREKENKVLSVSQRRALEQRIREIARNRPKCDDLIRGYKERKAGAKSAKKVWG